MAKTTQQKLFGSHICSLITLVVAALATLPIVSSSPLTPGLPVNGFVAVDAWSYYEVQLPGAASEKVLTVTVTPYAEADPDREQRLCFSCSRLSAVAVGSLPRLH